MAPILMNDMGVTDQVAWAVGFEPWPKEVGSDSAHYPEIGARVDPQILW